MTGRRTLRRAEKDENGLQRSSYRRLDTKRIFRRRHLRSPRFLPRGSDDFLYTCQERVSYLSAVEYFRLHYYRHIRRRISRYVLAIARLITFIIIIIIFLH